MQNQEIPMYNCVPKETFRCYRRKRQYKWNRISQGMSGTGNYWHGSSVSSLALSMQVEPP